MKMQNNDLTNNKIKNVSNYHKEKYVRTVFVDNAIKFLNSQKI